jgi:hypothetical protein
VIDWRYQDTFFQRSSGHRKHEIGAEQRRAVDLVVTLLEKQGLFDQSQIVRRMEDLKTIVSTLEGILVKRHE